MWGDERVGWSDSGARTWLLASAVRASGASEISQRDIDSMCDGVEDANTGIDPALFDLDQHPSGDAAALSEAVERETSCVSRLRHRMPERRKVHGWRRLDHKNSGKSEPELLSVQDTALNWEDVSLSTSPARCHPRERTDATPPARPRGRHRTGR